MVCGTHVCFWRFSISSSFGSQLTQECRWALLEHYVRTHIIEPPCSTSFQLKSQMFPIYSQKLTSKNFRSYKLRVLSKVTWLCRDYFKTFGSTSRIGARFSRNVRSSQWVQAESRNLNARLIRTANSYSQKRSTTTLLSQSSNLFNFLIFFLTPGLRCERHFNEFFCSKWTDFMWEMRWNALTYWEGAATLKFQRMFSKFLK